MVILADFISKYKFVSRATEVLHNIGLPFGAKNFIALGSNLVEYLCVNPASSKFWCRAGTVMAMSW